MVANWAARLGQSPDALLKVWSDVIKRKYEQVSNHKFVELRRVLDNLFKTADKASYNCRWMMSNQLCPLLTQDNKPSQALAACHGCNNTKEDHPVLYTKNRVQKCIP